MSVAGTASYASTFSTNFSCIYSSSGPLSEKLSGICLSEAFHHTFLRVLGHGIVSCRTSGQWAGLQLHQ